MADTDVKGRNKNIQIRKGQPISVGLNRPTTYAYTYVDFAKTQIIFTQSVKKDGETQNDFTGTDIRNIMLGKNAIIRMHSVGQYADGYGQTFDHLQNSEETTWFDIEDYKNLPCGVQTSQGSIISMPIVPSEHSVDRLNGLDIAGQQPEDCPYIWKVTHSGSSETKTARRYGYRTPTDYITNKNCRVDGDWPLIQTRTYDLNSMSGSCVICYNICEYNSVQENPPNDKTKPSLVVQINLAGGKVGNLLKITIPPTGPIKAILDGQAVTGGMPVPETDCLPVQCKKNPCLPSPPKPLFIYPTYFGIVITNCVNKNITDGGGEIFIKFSKNSSPIHSLQIKTMGGGEGIEDIQNLQAAEDEQSEGMNFKWIPALHQELGDSFKISVAPKQYAKFEGNIELQWIRALGDFAYCPLYFFNSLAFDLFFKVSYQAEEVNTQNSITYEYSVFPIVYQVGERTGDAQDGNDIDIDSSFYVDNDLEETIAKASFMYKQNKGYRYPTEIFGAIIATTITGNQFDVANENTEFTLNQTLTSSFQINKKNVFNNWFELITNCNITCGLQGISGSLTLDAYPLTNGLDVNLLSYNMGMINLDIYEGEKKIGNLFKGIGYQLSKSNSDNSYQYTINLVGMQQKMQDMKLICAPFWDGDQLKNIIRDYFENYLNLNIRMINHATTDISGALKASEIWTASPPSLVDEYTSTLFRVPRSMNWESPAVDFPTGTSCLQALKKLGDFTSCHFTVGLDGVGYFYQLNDYGYPYYVDNQENVTTFELNELISFSLQPQIGNKFNSITTMGFLQKRFKNGKVNTSQMNQSVTPGTVYTKLSAEEQGRIVIPWSRTQVYVESGFLTKLELYDSHAKRLKFARSNLYTGSITVLGNINVNHVYQKIKIDDESFFVTSIQHSIDLSSKLWTTTYQISKFEEVKQGE